MPQDRAQVPFPPPPPGQSGSDPSEGSRAGPLPGGTYFLGRYRVVDEIGIGGMASVHLARMDGPGGFQKWVAIKRIHPHLVEDETFVNMFLDEARVAARISHPNVATVFELGKHEDTYWIAMEYLHGEPLREVMRRTEELGQPMPPEIACRVIADAAEGLHAAHELLGKNGEKLGLVHRDVTPHNLFVTYDGNTKVVDFGIAKFTSRMANTRAGTLKGKLAYMSPEQVAGEPIDRRTDVFALGVVLWELTTGQRLFRMESDLDTLAKVQECNVPRPSTIVRGYPIDLEKIVMKALAKTKNERYRTAREFSRALQSLLMRRGLFIASDEVAAYMVSVFNDRIQKREAHLRWAAEVTQTIDIDKMKGALPPSPWQGDDGSILTFNSEVQASQPNTARAAPRPAAGMPAAPSQPTPIAPVSVPVPVHSPPRPVAQPVLSAKSTLRLGAMPVATTPPPVEPPKRGSLPSINDSRSDDPPTLALPRDSAIPPTPPAAQQPAPFEDDFDDAGDTIVSDSLPDMDLTASPRPVPAAGMPAPPPPLGTTLTSAASPNAMAAGPRPAPPRQPTPPPMPAVVVPPGASMGATLPLPPSDDTRSTLAKEGHLAYPQPLLRGSMSNEFAVPGAPGQHPHPGYAPHGPADMQRLFAPPIPNDQRTVTAQALRKRIPLWAVAAGSAVMGLIAFAVVVLALSHGSSHQPAAKAAASASGAPVVVVAAAPGPFVSARNEFASAAGSAPSQTDNATAPTATPPAATPSAAQPPAPPPEPVIPTANVGSLPTAGPSRGSSRSAPIAVAAPAAAGGTTGTLKIICLPGCDQVVDNGASLGPSPVVRHNASVGSHRIKLVWSDSTKVVSTIVLAEQTATVRESHP